MQANITRVNRTYYSDLNLVFHCEVSKGDQGSSDLYTIVCDWLRCITRSLHFPPKHQDIDYCQRQLSPLAAHLLLEQAGAFRSCPVYAVVKSQNVRTEGHGHGDLSAGVAGGKSVLAQASFWWHSALASGLDAAAPASPAWQSSSGLFMLIISSTCLNLWSSASFLHSVNQ